MGRIYKGQSALRITLQTFCELTGAVSVVIKYRKSDGFSGELTAAIADEAKGVIFHEVLEGELDSTGWWSFWAFVTFADGRTAAGEPSRVYIWNEGG